MKNKKSKNEIVGILLNQDLKKKDKEELKKLLIKEPISIDIDKEMEENITLGDKIADKITLIAGSWKFIISFTLFILTWVVINLFVLDDLDPYPFILLNLLLSCIAALQAPIIMMSQNREAKKDSLRNANDYKIDLKSELILEELHAKMEKILDNQKKIIKELLEDKN